MVFFSFPYQMHQLISQRLVFCSQRWTTSFLSLSVHPVSFSQLLLDIMIHPWKISVCGYGSFGNTTVHNGYGT